MTGGVVIQRTKGRAPAPAPELEPVEDVMRIIDRLEQVIDTGDAERVAYMLEHAPQLLAALIIRRSGTGPDQLVEQAATSAGKLYDHIRSVS